MTVWRRTIERNQTKPNHTRLPVRRNPVGGTSELRRDSQNQCVMGSMDIMQDAIMQWECVCAHNTQRNTASPPNIITKIHMQRVNIAETSDEKSLWREITENRRFVSIYIYIYDVRN